MNWDQDKHDEQLEKPLQMDVESLARLIQDEKKYRSSYGRSCRPLLRKEDLKWLP